MFDIIIEQKADKALLALDAAQRPQIAEDVYSLQTCFMNGKRLTGKFQGFRSLRSGNYRIIYRVDVDNNTVRVTRVGHRKDVYR